MGIKGNGEQCRLWGSRVNSSGFCKYHDLCGQPTKTGGRCRIPAYKCPHHGPGRAPVCNRTDQNIFRLDGLRNEKWTVVKEYRGGVDAYSKVEVNDLATYSGCRNVQMDHVIECQVVRDNYDLIQKQGTNFAKKKQDLAEALRSRVVNEVENLNITATCINKEKGAAVLEFQGTYLDQRKNNPEMGLSRFLLQNTVTEEARKLGRKESGRITRELHKSWGAIEDSLEHDQPLQEEFSSLFYKNIAAMKLKSN